MLSRRTMLLAGAAGLAGVAQAVEGAESPTATAGKSGKFVRFRHGTTTSYGLVLADQVRRLEGDLFGKWSETKEHFALKDLQLLSPTTPTQVLALAGNYRSHLKEETIPPKFQIPQIFFKTPSCLIAHGDSIVLPRGSAPVHYEAELVLDIGKTARNVAKEDALKYVFGATCGNDVSARDWQKNDVQWWRAKGCDTFGPCGPMIVTGLNYDDLLLQLRLNGEVRQKERTSLLIHDVATMVSYISQHITMYPGDLIYTGTPGKTQEIKPGDTVEVEIEGIGVLKNPVIAAK